MRKAMDQFDNLWCSATATKGQPRNHVKSSWGLTCQENKRSVAASRRKRPPQLQQNATLKRPRFAPKPVTCTYSPSGPLLAPTAKQKKRQLETQELATFSYQSKRPCVAEKSLKLPRVRRWRVYKAAYASAQDLASLVGPVSETDAEHRRRHNDDSWRDKCPRCFYLLRRPALETYVRGRNRLKFGTSGLLRQLGPNWISPKPSFFAGCWGLGCSYCAAGMV